MKKKQALLTSGLCLGLSAALLAGTTFAWFTDSVTNEGNVIQSGKLDVRANGYSWDATAETWGDPDYNLSQPLMNDSTWEPGQYNAKVIKVSNWNSNLAAKVELKFDLVSSVNDLEDALWYRITKVENNDANYINDIAEQLHYRDQNSRPSSTDEEVTCLNAIEEDDTGASTLVYQKVDDGNKYVYYLIEYGMYTDAGNQYQGGSIDLDFSVLATQASYEEDGFGSDLYDADAEWPVVPDTTVPSTGDATADGAALKEAIINAESGDVIGVPAGTYNVDELDIGKDVTLVGAGADKTVFQQTKRQEKLIKVGNVDFSMSGIHVQGMETPANNDQSAVWVETGTEDADNQVSITDCKITGFTKNSITVKGGNATITGNEIECKGFDGAAGNGIQVDMGAVATITGNTITAYQSQAEGWSATGVLVLRDGQATVKDNTIRNCQYGIMLERYWDYAIPGDYTSTCNYPDTKLTENGNSFSNCGTDVFERATNVNN